MILLGLLNFFPHFVLAESPGPVGPVGPVVETGSEEEETTPNKPSVDLPYKPLTTKSDKPHKQSSDGEVPLNSPPAKTIPYVVSQSPEAVGAKDPVK